MKKITIFVSAAILLVALFAATAFKTSTPRPSANGQGTLTVNGESRHFSFSANTLENSSVEGSGQLTYTAGGSHVEFTIDCMSRVGNTATMSGTITSISGNSPFEVGWNCWFRVRDNGEGANATNPDMITLVYGSPSPLPCTATVSNALNPIEGGNIQVKN
ncbi:MAG: hypothetical protein ABIR78_05800 [Ferruginibacter sp.]